jgi:hypothetical protein
MVQVLGTHHAHLVDKAIAKATKVEGRANLFLKFERT